MNDADGETTEEEAPENRDRTGEPTSKQNVDHKEDGTSRTTSTKRDVPRVYLDPWEELRGRLTAMEETETELIVTLSAGRLHYPRRTPAAGILKQELKGHTGRRVAILLTDLSEPPVTVQVEADNVD